MKRCFLTIGIFLFTLSLSTTSCATVQGEPFSVEVVNTEGKTEVKNGDIAIYADSRDFLANNYAAAYRHAAREGYTRVLHWEVVKIGPFGMFGSHIRLTAVQR